VEREESADEEEDDEENLVQMIQQVALLFSFPNGGRRLPTLDSYQMNRKTAKQTKNHSFPKGTNQDGSNTPNQKRRKRKPETKMARNPPRPHAQIHPTS
jgi:hypothetical protein